MELTWLEDCLALAETLNFSRAAQRRFVTQPAFSRRIHALEEWLGTPLFTRSRKEVLMTPAGEAFVRKASGLVSGIYAARRKHWKWLGDTGLHWRSSPPMFFLSRSFRHLSGASNQTPVSVRFSWSPTRSGRAKN